MKNGMRLCLALIIALMGSAPCLRAYPQQVAQDDPCSATYHMTEKLRADSRVHKEYGLGPEKNLCRLVEGSPAPVLVEVGGLRELPAMSPTSQGYPNWFLRIFAHEADAVIVGVVKSSSSALIEDGSFIFTDAQVEVQEVIKDNLAAPIPRNTEITVTRPGGTIILKGKEVRAVDVEFDAFQVNGRYVLFLTFIHESGSYRAFSERSFQLLPRIATKVTRKPALVLPQSHNDPQAFVNEVRAAVVSAATWRDGR